MSFNQSVDALQINTSFEQKKYWQKIFWITAAFICITMPLLSPSYGLSGDEWIQIEYGRHIWEYFFNGNPQALNYDALNIHYKGQQFYGGVYDFGLEILHRLMPFIQQIALRHFVNAIAGAVLMVFTGLLAYRISRKWSAGLLAMLFIFLSPRIFGESMNNPKDIPFACGFIVTVYFLLAFLQDFPQKNRLHAMGIALGFTLAFGVRSAGGFLLLTYIVVFTAVFIWWHAEIKARLLADSKRLLKQLLLYLTGAILAGYILALLAWPWGLQSPVLHPLISLKEMTHRTTLFKVLFDGAYRSNTHMPWYYEIKWMTMTNPVVVLVGIALFVGCTLKAIKKYTVASYALLICGAFFPLVYMIIKHATVYDTWRHVFFVYPFWAVLAALGFDMINEYMGSLKKNHVPLFIALAGLLPSVVWMVRSHPNQYVYFNELSGGIKNAYTRYELDYYQNTSKQAADWIHAHTKPVPGRKILVLSNMTGFDKYFLNDTAWLKVDTCYYEERHFRVFDYYVANGRFIPVAQLENGLWPPQNLVHTISLDEVPLTVIIANRTSLGKEAHDAFVNADYATAVLKYEAYLKLDSLDEYALINYGLSLANLGAIDKAIAQINKATALSPMNTSYYDGLRNLYQIQGDKRKAQAMLIKATEVKNEQEQLEQNTD